MRPETLDKKGKFTDIFFKVVGRYVKYYPDYSFRFIFDGHRYPVIGNSENVVEVFITDAEKVFERIFAEGSLGLAEAYCEGHIHTEDSLYKEFLFIFIRTLHDKRLLFGLSPVSLFKIARVKMRQESYSSGDQAKDMNGHYSLSDWFDNGEDSNTFYLLWLNSRYIQYSCGKWDEETASLEEAQRNKFEFYAKRLGIGKASAGKTLLDLGCGWGGLMFYMAEKYGVVCKGLTLSHAQAKYVEEEIRNRKLEHLVSVEIRDIHDMKGTYDYIASVGVLEHVSNYDDLYEKTARCLGENGSALFHSMFHTTLLYQADPFILKYVFRKGAVPHIKRNLRIFSRYFNYVDRNDLPDLSYPKTLACWYEAFCANEAAIRNLLRDKGKKADIDFSIRIFKHYLMLSYCGLTVKGLVSNILVRKQR